MSAGVTLFTIGHGARSLDDFLALLASAEVDSLIDVRARPASRRHPHFERAALTEALAEVGTAYVFEGRDLGGFRSPDTDSRHAALATDALRGYADHMATVGFRAAADRVVERATGTRVALLCAERFPVDCHRNLLSDHLTRAGARVVHLIDSAIRHDHRLNPAARQEGELLVYDAGRGRQRTFGFD